MPDLNSYLFELYASQKKESSSCEFKDTIVKVNAKILIRIEPAQAGQRNGDSDSDRVTNLHKVPKISPGDKRN